MQKNKGEEKDLRIVKTVRALQESLFLLLEDMPFDKITVLDICEKAEVHRTTFYKHFPDKYQLLTNALDELKDEIYKRAISVKEFYSSKDMYLHLVNVFLKYFQLKKSRIVAIVENLKEENIRSVILQSFEKSIKYLLYKNKSRLKYKVPVNILSNFFTGGFSSVLFWWLQNEEECSREELIKYISVILDKDVYVEKK